MRDAGKLADEVLEDLEKYQVLAELDDGSEKKFINEHKIQEEFDISLEKAREVKAIANQLQDVAEDEREAWMAPREIPDEVVRAISGQPLPVLRATNNWLENLIEELERKESMKKEVENTEESGMQVYSPGPTIQAEKVKCGKDRCSSCPHGPYLYAYWKEGGKTVSAYIGSV